VRLGKRSFGVQIKGDLQVEFGAEQLTSHAGLELFGRYVDRLGLRRQLRSAERRLGWQGDFRLGACVLLVVGMLLVGARRLRHVAFLAGDPVVRRFAGLRRLPSERTLSRSLKKLGHRSWPVLDQLILALLGRSVAPLELKRATLDIDGSVLTTGLKVERAERGFNPHHRKNPSYYPLMAVLAQTTHVIAHRNRPGNVHDSHGSARFLRKAVSTVRTELPTVQTVEVRVDSAFFQQEFLAACDDLGVEYAVKVPMWPWLNLREVVARQNQRNWERVETKAGVEGLMTWLWVVPWKRAERIAIFRKPVGHEPVKGKQLELFNPDDGNWEYSVVATNKDLGLRALWDFANGRGAQEKVLAELKSGLAYDCIPTCRYSANTAWQKLNILAHNLNVSFQLATIARPKPRSLKRTANFLIRSIRTLRFEWLNKAARLLRPGNVATLRLADAPATRRTVEKIEQRLAQAA
jgi:hypothetical protein